MTAEILDVQVELQNKLNNLKRNKEVLSEEELTGKYGKAYNKLLDEIKQLKAQFITKRLTGIFVSKNTSGVESVWNDYLKKINKAIYEDYSVEKAEFILEEFVGLMFTDYHSVHAFNLD